MDEFSDQPEFLREACWIAANLLYEEHDLVSILVEKG